MSREDILREVINYINKNYGKRKEIEAARAAAVERRKAESVQQDGDAEEGSGGSENTGGSGRGQRKTRGVISDLAIALGYRSDKPKQTCSPRRDRRK